MAGDGQYYHETRPPLRQTGNYSQITLSTTSKAIMSITNDLTGSAFVTPAGYWDIGKKWRVHMFGKATTSTTPGNITIEIRAQSGTVTDAGGTILATSGAVALGASKTDASWYMEFTVESREQVNSAADIMAKGWFMTDPTTALVASTANPIFIPTTAPVVASIDTTLGQTINVQWKRSGSTAETVTVVDYQIDVLT